MLFYIENLKTKRAYADQELQAWDRIKGELPDDVVAVREEKQAAIEAAIAVEESKGEVDLKNPPKEITDKENELKAALVAELAAHELTKFDAVQQKTVADDLSAPTYACSWDGVTPYVTTITGTFPVEGISIMGWPQTDVPPDSPSGIDSPPQ